jgi:hypothetical protein
LKVEIIAMNFTNNFMKEPQISGQFSSYHIRTSSLFFWEQQFGDPRTMTLITGGGLAPFIYMCIILLLTNVVIV